VAATLVSGSGKNEDGGWPAEHGQAALNSSPPKWFGATRAPSRVVGGEVVVGISVPRLSLLQEALVGEAIMPSPSQQWAGDRALPLDAYPTKSVAAATGLGVLLSLLWDCLGIFLEKKDWCGFTLFLRCGLDGYHQGSSSLFTIKQF
jgi:hypothetical protein